MAEEITIPSWEKNEDSKYKVEDNAVKEQSERFSLEIIQTDLELDVKGEILLYAVAEPYTLDLKNENTVDNSCDARMDLGEETDTKQENCQIDEEPCIEIKPAGDCLNSTELIPVEVKLEDQGSEIQLLYRCDNVPDVDIPEYTQEKTSSDSHHGVEIRQLDDHNAKTKSSDYTCNICRMEFQQQSGLLEHIQARHVKNGLYNCNICNIGFKRENALIVHMLTMHRAETSCRVCGEEVLGGLGKHMMKHHQQVFVYTSNVCRKEFKQQSSHIVHTQAKHVKNGLHNCKICNMGFKLEHNLYNHKCKGLRKEIIIDRRKHVMKHNRQQNGLIKHIQAKYVKNDLNNGSVCSICEEEFTQKDKFSTHMRMHKKEKGFKKQCDLTAPMRRRSREEADVKGEILHDAVAEPYTLDLKNENTVDNSCDSRMDLGEETQTDTKQENCQIDEETCIEIKPVGYCLNSTELIPAEVKLEDQGSEIQLLNRCDNVPDVDIPEYTQEKTSSDSHHDVEMRQLDDHNAETKSSYYTCNICRMEFQQQSGLLEHIQARHVKNGLYNCNICNTGFRLENTLIGHMLTMHRAETSCRVCGEEVLGDLGKHMMKHSQKIYVYTCNVCTMEFQQRNSLIEHMQSTHMKNGLYMCNICNMGFNIEYNLINHLLSMHKAETSLCKVCGEEVSGDIQKHIMKHSLKISVYTCNVCRTTFQQQNGLIEHMRSTHIKNGIYTCNICNMGFKREYCLSTHMLSKHKGETCLCSVCGEEVSGDIQRHMMKHSLKIYVYTCTICEEEFTQKDKFSTHMRMHKKE